MRLLIAAIWLIPGMALAAVFSIVQVGDIHSSFGSSHNQYATNYVSWVLAHTNDGVFNNAINVWAGDNYEDNRDLTNGYDPSGSVYAAVQMTNDCRILSGSGIMNFITDGNHDANNTNNTYGGTFYTHPAPLIPWNTVFPPLFWTNQSYFHSNAVDGAYNQMAMRFQRGNIKLMLLSYHTDASTNCVVDGVYTNQSNWIRGVMRANPDYNCIICGHFFLGQSTTSYFDAVPSYQDHNQQYSNWVCGPGKAPVDAGLQNEPNCLGFISGHDLPLMKGIYLMTNIVGNIVFFVQFNQQQSSTSQDMDWVNVLTFDTAQSIVSCGTYTISTGLWLQDYSAVGGMTNAFFPGNFRHTFQVALPIRPWMYPVRR